MNKRLQAMVSVGAALLALGATACGDDDDAGEAGGSDPVKVAMISSGSHTDSSFVQSWWEGSEAASQSLGSAAEVTWTDGLNSLDALDRGAAAALTEGNDYLLISTSEAPQLVDEYAGKFEDRWICDVEPPRETYPENACTMFPKYPEGAFLAGALAGLVTRTNQVGAVYAFDIPIQNLQVEPFALRARYVNPDVRVTRSLTESFIDAGKARAAAQAQYAGGVDVILSGVDDATRGVLLAAEASDGLVIPQYTDQYELSPETVLTSVMYRHDRIGERMIELAVEGKLQAKSYEFGLADLGVGELAPFRGAPGKRVSEDVRKRLAELQRQIEDGTLVLPEVSALVKRGAGDELDPQTVEGGGN